MTDVCNWLIVVYTGLLLVVTDVCGWLIVRVCVMILRTVVGCDRRLWLVDRPGLCNDPEKDYCWL